MKKRVVTLLVVFMTACAAAFAGAEEPQAAAFDRYPGIWVADGLAVEIRREDEDMLCRAVITDGGEESVIWEYGECPYSEAEDTLLCLGVTRTRERFDPLTDTLDELDWSMNDMSLAEFRLTANGMVFTDEALDAPVTLTELSEARDSARKDALAFAGQWRGESASLRVEDHGSCYRFTITVPVDDVTSHRWSYTCLYDADDGRMGAVNSSARTVVTREADGSIIEVEEDFDAGDAEFFLENSDRLIWRDTSKGVDRVFERITG